MAEKKMGFATRAIHDGQEPEKVTGAVNVPIFLTSTYQQEEIGKNRGHEYARLTNPTRDALEESLARLKEEPARMPSPPAWPRLRRC